MLTNRTIPRNLPIVFIRTALKTNEILNFVSFVDKVDVSFRFPCSKHLQCVTVSAAMCQVVVQLL